MTLEKIEYGDTLGTFKKKTNSGLQTIDELQASVTTEPSPDKIVKSTPEGNLDRRWFPTASKTELGMVSIGSGLNVSSSGMVSPIFGTTALTIAQGNDERFSDARNPLTHGTSHKFGQIDAISVQNPIGFGTPAADENGKISSGWISDATTESKGVVSVGSGLSVNTGTVSVNFGTVAGTVAQGNDSRLSDMRIPVSHASLDNTFGLASDTSYGHTKATSTLPRVAGVANQGAEISTFSRGDHVHPEQEVVSRLKTSRKISLTGDIAGEVMFDGSSDVSILADVNSDSHTHSDTTIISLDASKLTGTIDIARIPHGALERLIIVEDDQARFALSSDKIQAGDTVKVESTNLMYFVVDQDNLANESGYVVYSSGRASAVNWSGIEGKPERFSPSLHADTHKHGGSDEIGSSVPGSNVIIKSDENGKISSGFIDTASDQTFGIVKTGSGIISENGQISVIWGSVPGSSVEGNDSRLSDARIPVSHDSSTSEFGVSSETKFGHIKISGTIPKALGIASKGLEDTAARGDHIHPEQESVLKLKNARKISLSGDVTGEVSFDGSSDVIIATTSVSGNVENIDASKITSGIIAEERLPKAVFTDIISVKTEEEKFLLTPEQAQEGDTVIVETTGSMYFVTDRNQLGSSNGFLQYTSGKASSVEWSGISGKPTEFVPTSHASTDIRFGISTTEEYGHVKTSNVLPVISGIASVGEDEGYARGDHIHPEQESVSKLKTPRTITITGDFVSLPVEFDGSSDIEIVVSNTGKTQKFTATNDWWRIAKSTDVISFGEFYLINETIGSESVTLLSAATIGKSNPALAQGISSFGTLKITKSRIVSNGTDAFLEIFHDNTSGEILIKNINGAGWEIITPVLGSIPEGFVSKELTFSTSIDVSPMSISGVAEFAAFPKVI